MKKLQQLVLALVLVLTAALAVFCAAAENGTTVYESGDYGYTLQADGSATITRYTGTAEELFVPSELDGHPVTCIGDSAFFPNDSGRQSTLAAPGGHSAFYFSCVSPKSIILPDSVTSIGDHAFASCSLLTSITIPDSVTHVGSRPFASCVNLTNIKVSPDHPTLATIDGVLFDKTEKQLICYPSARTRSSYVIPSGIISIDDYAFDYCVYLSDITIPDSVTSIGESAFYGCVSLESISLPDSVTSIGKFAFCVCTSLTNITLPNGLTCIEDGMFINNFSLASICLPKGVVKIGNRAFDGCLSLETITGSADWTAIGDNAFQGCPEILTLTVPRNSWAATWCKANGMNYTYPDALDWLNQ